MSRPLTPSAFPVVRVPRRPSIRADAIRDGSLLVGLLCGIGQAIGILPIPVDAKLNWLAGGWLGHLYPERWDDARISVFVYPPPLAIVASALHAIPYELYLVLMTTLLFGCLWYCAGRWTPAILVAGLVGMVVPILGPLHVPLGYALNGNIQLVLAAAVVVSLRHPAVWSLPILTKVGPGIGLVWHLVRREWAALAAALGATAIIIVLTFIVAPGAWLDYLGFVQRSSDMQVPLEVVSVPWAVRLAMSGDLIAWGGATNRSWTVPVGVGWAMPALYPWTFLGIWIGAIRLSGIDRRRIRDLPRLTDRMACTRVRGAGQMIEEGRGHGVADEADARDRRRQPMIEPIACRGRGRSDPDEAIQAMTGASSQGMSPSE